MAQQHPITEIVKSEAGDEAVIMVMVAVVEGSAPREAGAWMLVNDETTRGTIGGGQLEFEAIAHARRLLGEAADDGTAWQRNVRAWPLGPSLGQCCGGAVRVLFERYGGHERRQLADILGGAEADGVVVHPFEPGRPVRVLRSRQEAREMALPLAKVAGDMLSGAQARRVQVVAGPSGNDGCIIVPIGRKATPLFVYGAGHVGRAIVKAVAELDFDVHWVDTHEERFPEVFPGPAVRVVARDPAVIARAAPSQAFHLVLTYSHAIDLAICHALLTAPAFGFLGLIGSETKRTRFIKRLREGGVSEDALARLTCPIGIGRLRGKAPATIAISVAAQLIEKLEEAEASERSPEEGEHGKSRRVSA